MLSIVTDHSVRLPPDSASITLIQAFAVLELTEADFAFLTTNHVWLATAHSTKLNQPSTLVDVTEDYGECRTNNKVCNASHRSRAVRRVQPFVYRRLHFGGYPRFPTPFFFFNARTPPDVHPLPLQTALPI